MRSLLKKFRRPTRPASRRRCARAFESLEERTVLMAHNMVDFVVLFDTSVSIAGDSPLEGLDAEEWLADRITAIDDDLTARSRDINGSDVFIDIEYGLIHINARSPQSVGFANHVLERGNLAQFTSDLRTLPEEGEPGNLAGGNEEAYEWRATQKLIHVL